MNIEPGKTAGRLGKLLPNPKAKLRDQFHEVCRFKYFSQRTEDSYWQWVVRFLRFHRDHPAWRVRIDRLEPRKDRRRRWAPAGQLPLLPCAVRRRGDLNYGRTRYDVRWISRLAGPGLRKGSFLR